MSKKLDSSEKLLEIIKTNAAKRGRYLNRDEIFVKELVDGLYANLQRYGYASCPCRLAAQNYEFDKDILCPCIYMKDDVDKYGMCFCCLYVSKEVFDGIKYSHSIPESRPKEKTFNNVIAADKKTAVSPTWKCGVCGYEHETDEPPEKCPVCGAAKESFIKNLPDII
ncbi:MAG: hypothetical protein LBD46_05710 [Endomicrobium sp.]|jgi:ferredoxin-thioredoxin reductase catalytic subunit|nr:hypothetical protein [Endomicrobium sp.]